MLSADENMIRGVDNKHFHSGVAVSDLYIEAKYGSFKEEWQNYAHLNVQQAEKAMTKANEFMKSEEVKAMTARAIGGYKQMFFTLRYCHRRSIEFMAYFVIDFLL